MGILTYMHNYICKYCIYAYYIHICKYINIFKINACNVYLCIFLWNEIGINT